MQSRRSLKKEIEARDRRIKELTKQCDEVYSENKRLEAKSRSSRMMDAVLTDMRHSSIADAFEITALKSEIEALRNAVVGRSEQIGELQLKIKNLKVNSVSDLENAVNEIIILELCEAIKNKHLQLKNIKETDWEKKYHKVMRKLEKITNKKPF